MFDYLYTMPKQQYKYNPDSLSYEALEVSLGKKILKLILWIAPSILFGLVMAIIFTQKIDSPKEIQYAIELKSNAKELKKIQQDVKLANEVLDIIQGRDEEIYRAALYADEFPKELRQMGTGGSDKYDYLNGMTNSDLFISTASQIDKLEKRLHAQSLSFKELLDLAKEKENILACIPAIQPVRNTDLNRRIGGFGWRIDPIYKTRKRHAGIDFTANKGTEVYATGDGVVVALERKKWGYGLSIIIDHGYGYQTRYAHLSKFKVKIGQKIKRGELIGLIGSTGKSTGPHLHYEVAVNGVKVNPIGYFHSDLTPEQYEKMLEMSKNSHQAMD